MKAAIFVNQNEVVKAGKKDYGVKEVEFDPADLSLDERAEIITCEKIFFQSDASKFGLTAASCDDYIINFKNAPELKPVSEANFDILKELLHERIEVRAKEEAKEKKKEAEELAKRNEALAKEVSVIEAWAQLPVEKRLRITWKSGQGKVFEINIPSLPYTYRSGSDSERFYKYVKDHSEIQFVIDKTMFEAQRLNEIEKKEVERLAVINVAKKEAKEAEEARLEIEHQIKTARKDKQIFAWVSEHGTDNQKARLAENLLPKQEIIDLIKEEVYAPLRDWSLYEKMAAGGVCDCDYGICDVDFSVDTKKFATAKEYDQMQEIRKLLLNATVELREHAGESSECENTVTAVGILVKLTVGEFKFSREYAVKE